MKTTMQPKTTTPPAAAPEKPIPAYQPSSSGRVSFLIENASNREREFFYKLLDAWEEGMYPLPEAAFMYGARALGITWISEVEDITAEDKMFRGLHMVMLQNDWLARFLRSLLESYNYSNPLTADDVAEDLESHLIAFHHEIRDARNLIESHPETVAGEIQKAIQKHPDLLSAA